MVKFGRLSVMIGGVQMDEAKNLPEKIWIGPLYSEFGVFVLGESWYGDYPDHLATDDGYIREYLAGRQPDGMYTKMAKACAMTNPEFWNRIMFTNFVQRVGQFRKNRPKLEQYEAAAPRLEKLLVDHKPRGVWILGKEQGKYSKLVVESAGIPFEVTTHPTGYGVTSAELGASWEKLLKKMDANTGDPGSSAPSEVSARLEIPWRASAMTDSSIPLKYQSLFHRVIDLQSKSKADAIKAFCLHCVGFKFKRVTNCTSPKCPLFNVRPYQKNSGGDGVTT